MSAPALPTASVSRRAVRSVAGRAGLSALAAAGLAAIWLLPLSDAVGLAGLVAIAAVTLRYPVAGLCLLGLSVPWGTAVPSPAGSSLITPTDLIAALVGGVWLADAAVRRRNPISDRVIAPYIFLYLAAIAVSATQATDLPATAREIIKWTEFTVVFFASVSLLRSRSEIRFVAAALVAGGVSQALLGYAQFVLQLGPAAFGLHRPFFRSYGTFDQPNPYAGYLNMVLPLAIALAFRAGRAWERTLYAIAATLMALAVLASQSRGALIAGVGAALVLALYLVPRSRAPLTVVAVAGVAFLVGTSFGLVPLGPIGRVLSAVGLGGISFGNVTDANFSAVERAAHWLAGVRMFAAHPLLGVGIGNYSAAYPAYHPRGWYASLEHAHNYFINIAAEAGIIGLTSYVLLTGSALWYSYAITRQARTGACFAVALGSLGALTATTLHNLFDVLYVHGMATLLALIAALAPAVLRIEREATRESSSGDGA
jgi:O-antigen ligase